MTQPIAFTTAYRAASLTQDAALRLCRRLGIALFKQPAYARRWFMTPEDAERLRREADPAAIKDGLTGREAAQALGISRQRVHVLLAQGKLTRSPSGLVERESVARRICPGRRAASSRDERGE